MSNPNEVDQEYVEFVAQGTWKTNLEFFHAARKFERDKIHSKLNQDLVYGDYSMSFGNYEELFNGYEP